MYNVHVLYMYIQLTQALGMAKTATASLGKFTPSLVSLTKLHVYNTTSSTTNIFFTIFIRFYIAKRTSSKERQETEG